MSRPTIILLAFILAACGGPRTTTIKVTLPDMDGRETPASGIPVIAAPYDRDSLLLSLERAQGSPRPHTEELDSLFAEFRGPFVEHFRAGQALSSVRDSVSRGLLGPRTADSAAARVERTRIALERVRSRLAVRGDSLRARVRSWEDSTYRDFDSLAKSLARRARRELVIDTTDATGHATIRIPASRSEWWVTAGSWDATDPNMSWYWNVKIVGDTTVLDSRSGRRRPRY